MEMKIVKTKNGIFFADTDGDKWSIEELDSKTQEAISDEENHKSSDVEGYDRVLVLDSAYIEQNTEDSSEFIDIGAELSKYSKLTKENDNYYAFDTELDTATWKSSTGLYFFFANN